MDAHQTYSLSLFFLSVLSSAFCHAQPITEQIYAQNFAIEHFETHRILSIHIGYLEAIDKLDTIVGAGTVNFISNSEVRARVQSKDIQSAQVGQGLNIERMLRLQPDLIFTSISGDPAFDVPAKLARSGLPVVLTAGYMEAHPLARAEWIKYIAAFFEADATAQIQFEQVANHYQALKAKVASVESQPTVFCRCAPFGRMACRRRRELHRPSHSRCGGGDYL